MTSMDRDSEIALVAGLRDGDPAAFDQVYAAYHGRLFGFLARLSCRREVAEDLVEETWLRVVTNAKRLRPDTALAPWLFTIARNLYLSYCRSRLLETGHVSDLVGLWPFGRLQLSPFEETAANETERRLESALAGLPAASREVLLLVGVEGLSPAEGAAVCEISTEAFRQRLHRARVQLARLIDRTGARAVPGMKEATT
jgi:RNA polymerase sigma-70 factor (ECF subfamily)